MMIPFFSRIYARFQSNALAHEWKRAFQLKRDYEALSELSKYISQQLENLDNTDILRFFSLGRSGVIGDPVFSEFETYMDNGLPPTLKDCLAQITDEDFAVFQEHLASHLDNKIDLNNLEYLVFSGGGAKGMAYPGVLKALKEIKHPQKTDEKQSLFDNIKETSGASAGALISLPLAMGYSPEQIEKIVTENRYEHFFDESIVSSHGIRAELTRHLKKISGGLRRKLAEVEYIDVFTRELNKKMIQFTAQMIGEDEAKRKNRDLTKDELQGYEDSVKTQLLTMTHHEMISFCEFLNNDCNVLDEWVSEASVIAEKKVKGKIFNYLTKKFPDFGGFNNAFDAMKFSIRRFYGSDKIEEFMADIIEDALDSVPEKDLERVLPSMTIQADNMLLRNVAIVLEKINRYAAPRLSDAGYPIGQSEGWRKALDEMISQNVNYHGIWKDNEGYHWGDLLSDVKEHKMDKHELNTALSAIRELSDHNFDQALHACRAINLDHYKAGKQIKTMLPKWAFKHQRRLYKRNLNFLELSELANKLPQYGFKKLHITMCRLDGKVEPAKMIFDHETFLDERYKLAMGSHLSNEYSRMPIKTSARISMNLPVGFEKKVYYGESFIDGGVVSNTPSHIFMKEPYFGKNKTLTCMLGDNSFFEGGRHIKEAVKGTRLSPVDKIKMFKNPLIPIGKLISWAAYKLNPNYEKLTNDDLSRTLFVQTGNVSTGDFGVSKEKKLEIIERARKDARQFLNNQEDAQYIFLCARLNSIEDSLKSIGYDKPSVKEENAIVQSALREGIFSTGQVAKMHEEMASEESMKKYLGKKRSAIASQGLNL